MPRRRPMETLRHLLTHHAPLLLIDSASTVVHAGVAVGPAVGGEGWCWSQATEEAGSGVFRCVEAALTAAGLGIADIRGFAFCEGPGSVLGIRTAAVALRTWRVVNPAPVFSYQSLALVAATLDRRGVTIVADARRDSWHAVSIGVDGNRDTASNALRRIPSAELAGPLVMPAGFRNWTPLPAGLETVSYDLPARLAAAVDHALFVPTEEPDAFMHEAPAYATWTPRVHQAPPASPTAR